MKNYLKFLSRLPKSLRDSLLATLEKILCGDLEDLDIKPLKGTKGIYRCRQGKLRIIFRKLHGECEILDIGFRGDVYK